MTLRNRLLCAVGLLVVLLLVSSFAVTRIATAFIVEQVDDQLDRFLNPAVAAMPVPPRFPQADAPGNTPFSTLYVGSFEGDRLVTVLAPGIGEESAAVPTITRAEADRLVSTEGHVSVGSTVDGTDYRLAARSGATGSAVGSDEVVVIGMQLTDADVAVRRLVLLQLVASGVVIAVLSLVTSWVLRLGVRPLRQMTSAAAHVADGDLEFRLPEAPAGSEAAQLGAALNTMLERTEVALNQSRLSEQRLRQFLADASHELRTPITTIRGYAELHRLGGLDDGGARAVAMERVEAEAVRMGTMVENLLMLARLDQRTESIRERVDLGRIVNQVLSDLAVVFPDRPIDADVGAATVNGVADHLQQVVTNLLANAMLHTRAGTAVSVDLTDHPEIDSIRLRVVDRGPGMSFFDRERAFERFYRADPSRSRASGGSGLGLSIVAGIVREHGGAVWLEPTSPGDPVAPGITVTVHLPRSSDDAPRPRRG